MIDYKLINNSIEYYENIGFKRIETPWLVTEAVDSITRPKDVQPFIVEAKKKNIKNELIKTDKVDKYSLEKVVTDAKYFFDSILPIKTYVQETNDGFDIMVDDFELGSYGIRECDFLEWIYGTACAEPRTSKLITLYNK